MKLAIFDVDGTLTRTLAIDADCFVRAFAEEFDITGIDTDWGGYEHYTDSGIADQVFREKLGREPSLEELQQLVVRFLFLLGKAAEDQLSLFRETPGAAKAVARLRKESGWKIAIATGCWLESALFKLDRADINCRNIPMASADDSMVREKIAQLALRRACSFYKARHFKKVVYVGDGAWDVKVAAKLGFSFLGVGDEKKQKLLFEAGGRQFIPDFSDYNLFLKKLDEATVPV